MVYGDSAVKALVTLVLEDLSSGASTHIREHTTNWELHLWDPVASSDLHRYPHVHSYVYTHSKILKRFFKEKEGKVRTTWK